MNNPRLMLFKIAIDFLGKDVTPQDEVPDDVACAEVVNELHRKAFGFPVVWEESKQPSTYHLLDALIKHPLFQPITSPLEGDVVIAATGTGNGKIKGHVGIMGQRNAIMSNDSSNGLFLENYSLDMFIKKYENFGGMKARYFRRVEINKQS